MTQLERIVIAGTSGAGKSTLARRVSAVLGIPYVELDALYHGANWTPREEFRDDVSRFIAQDEWVTEWGYDREQLAARATTLVFLDYALTVIMWRVTRRTVRRWVRREVLWNGNREPVPWSFLWNRGNIIRWAWSTHALNRQRTDALRDHHPHLQVIRLRSPREAEAWLASVGDSDNESSLSHVRRRCGEGLR